MKFLVAFAFLSTIPIANWLIGNIGIKCIPDGSCLIPVWFGVLAPSGVLAIGAALVLRDAVHELLGMRWAIALILAGAVLSATFAPAALVIASGLAFLFSEMVDLGVYAPLRARGLYVAVAASGLVGALVDSVLFLWIAFGSLEFLLGQIIGKMWAVVFAWAAIAIWRYSMQRWALR